MIAPSPSRLDTTRASRRYALLTAAICVLFVIFKFWLLGWVPASGLYADDYDYLNKAVHYLRGDWKLEEYPFTRVTTSPVYSLLLSPWMLFDDVGARHTAVFGINFLLGALAVFFASLTVAKLAGRCSPWIPVCLALFGVVFQFNFYVMTENLLFVGLALVAWCVADFPMSVRQWRRLSLLGLAVALTTLARVPGMAVVPALLVLVLRHRSDLGMQRSLRAALVILGSSLVPHLLVREVLLESTRTGSYLFSIRAAVGDGSTGAIAGYATHIGALILSQAGYVFVAASYWVLPLGMVLALQLRHWEPSLDRRRWLDFLWFAGLAAAGLVAFCVVHMVQKLRVDPSVPTLVYGRYNDPALLLVVLAGLPAVFVVRPPSRLETILLRFVAPAALAVTLVLWWGVKWVPINQAGLALLPLLERLPRWSLLPVVVFVFALPELVARPRLGVPVLLASFALFNAASIAEGSRYTAMRAARAAYPLEAADWIHSNVPADATIACDSGVGGQPAVGSLKRMRSVYRAMYFATYPRRVVVAPAKGWDEADYVFGRRLADERLELVWHNEDYFLYRVQ